MANDLEYLFMCLFAIHTSLVMDLFKIFLPIFVLNCFLFTEFSEFFIFRVHILYLKCDWQIISVRLCSLFTFSFKEEKLLILMK